MSIVQKLTTLFGLLGAQTENAVGAANTGLINADPKTSAEYEYQQKFAELGRVSDELEACREQLKIEKADLAPAIKNLEEAKAAGRIVKAELDALKAKEAAGETVDPQVMAEKSKSLDEAFVEVRAAQKKLDKEQAEAIQAQEAFDFAETNYREMSEEVQAFRQAVADVRSESQVAQARKNLAESRLARQKKLEDRRRGVSDGSSVLDVLSAQTAKLNQEAASAENLTGLLKPAPMSASLAAAKAQVSGDAKSQDELAAELFN